MAGIIQQPATTRKLIDSLPMKGATGFIPVLHTFKNGADNEAEVFLKKILIVSHLKKYIEEEKSILNRAGYKIFTASSGQETLDMHKSEKADLIIAELDMPGISGDKLCSIIKMDKRLGGTSVILVCSNNRPEISKCSNSGADSYITRPIKASLLQKKIRELLNIQKRESLRLPMEVTLVGSYFYKTFFCYAVDISATGLMIETEKVLHIGKSVSCLLGVPDSRQIIIHGKIVRVSHKSPEIYQYGINIYPLNPDSQSVIEAFIKISNSSC